MYTVLYTTGSFLKVPTCYWARKKVGVSGFRGLDFSVLLSRCLQDNAILVGTPEVFRRALVDCGFIQALVSKSTAG